jgi:hypothetical protein
MVVTPEASASGICWGLMKWMWQSMPPAVSSWPSPAMTSVVTPDHHARRHAGHDVRVTGLANAHDAPALNADVGLENAGVIHHQRVGNDQIQRVGLGNTGGLAHAVAQHLAAAELAFLAVHAVVAFHGYQQVGIAEAHPVAGGGAVHVGIRATRDGEGHGNILAGRDFWQ